MVTLYTTGCPKCLVIEAKLKMKEINYTIVDDMDEMEKLGIMSVPMLKVDDQLLSFKQANDWLNQQ